LCLEGEVVHGVEFLELPLHFLLGDVVVEGLAEGCEPVNADESPEEASNDTSACLGPDFANSSRFHSAPFQRRQ
jgi:hypothetical protein